PAGGSRGPGNLRWIVLGVAVVALLILLVFFFRGRGGQTTAENPTGVPAEIATPTAESGLGTNATLPPTAELTPTAEPTPTARLPPTPEAAPTAAPPPTDLSGANPQPVAVGAELSASGWRFTFPGICLGSCATVLGPQVGNFTAKGNYVVVLLLV